MNASSSVSSNLRAMRQTLASEGVSESTVEAMTRVFAALGDDQPEHLRRRVRTARAHERCSIKIT